MTKRRQHLVCPVALDGYHVWITPPAHHNLSTMFAECKACHAVLWTPKQVVVSSPRPTTSYPQMAAKNPQHITGDVKASPPNERDDSDASEPEV